MATTNTIFKDILGVKGVVVKKHEIYTDSNQVVHLRIKVRVSAKERNRCPICGRKCKRYDAPHSRKVWRALDCSGIKKGHKYITVTIEYDWGRTQKFRFESFCYGPRNCRLYRMGRPRAVPYKGCGSFYDEGWMDDICTENRQDDDE